MCNKLNQVRHSLLAAIRGGHGPLDGSMSNCTVCEANKQRLEPFAKTCLWLSPPHHAGIQTSAIYPSWSPRAAPSRGLRTPHSLRLILTPVRPPRNDRTRLPHPPVFAVWAMARVPPQRPISRIQREQVSRRERLFCGLSHNSDSSPV